MKALYARQSLDKKDSLSIESQIEQCKYRLKENEPYKSYTDHGYSGKNTERPALSELIRDIKSNQIDGVIVYRLDRFSRNIIDFYNLYDIMQTHKCEFISVSENFDTSSPMGRATMSILITFAQMERESIQQRVKDNYYYRVSEDGRWAGGPAPYGYQNGQTEDRKPTLIPVPLEIDAVKLMFELYSTEVNISLGMICRTLTEKGYKSRRKNGSWDSSTVSKILQNPIYVQADSKLYKYLEIRQIRFLNQPSQWTGKTSCHIVGKRTGNANIRKYTDFKEQSVYLTNIPPIIDSLTYIRVMNRLGQNQQLARANKPSVLQELGGKLKCECGYAIKAYSKSTTGRPYLDCYGNRSLHVCGHKYNTFHFYELQAQIGGEIQKQLDHLSDMLKVKYQVRQEKEERINALKQQLDRLVDLAAISASLEEAVITKIESTQREIKELQLDLQMNSDILNNLHPQLRASSKVGYNNLTLEEKKYIVNLFIEKIVLHEKTGEVEIFWKI